MDKNIRDFNQFPPIKFLIVLNKMYKSIFDPINKHVKDLGVNETEFLILFALAANGSLSIQDIGERIYMTSGNMTYTIDKLEKKKLIERRRCVKDRRKIYVELTAEGQTFWDEVIMKHMTFLENLFGGIEEDELIESIEMMKVIGKTVSHKEE